VRVFLLALVLCNDAVLGSVAQQIADRKARGESTDEAQLTFLLRTAGDPHPWPRAWLGADPARGEQWNASWRRSGDARCGAAKGAVVGVDALADFDVPIPLRARTGQWISVEGRMLVPASAARVVVSTNDADPRTILSSFDPQTNRVRARVSADRPGTMTIQVIADLATGPRPVLEAIVFVDVEPKSPPNIAPGEWAGTDLASMLDAVRREVGLSTFSRDPALDAVALAHARSMMRQQSTSHDAGDGAPIERLHSAGISANEAGENVAHAASLVQAHRAIWNSPSHRKNLVRADFSRAGTAAVTDADGSVWVTEIFVR
jgi:uncharacterized protein YkwD